MPNAEMRMPKADDRSKAYFRSLVPDDPRVEVKPMFGNLAAFVNKNMFLALSGSSVSVRLLEPDRAELLKVKGTRPFEPMPGRPMTEYVTLPESWRKQRAKAAGWIERSMTYAAALPPKRKK
jgi:TfoX/Sxy family transcriptional regulator of competence genes